MQIKSVTRLLLVAALVFMAGSLAAAEEYTFQADVKRVMDVIINSLYKAKEIFLREVISNASDALDKARFLGITDKPIAEANPYYNITIEADKEAKTLSITDSGVGMTKEDLQNNLGTIAKSGTAEFAKQLADNADSMGMIGQFGVGAYSVFLVADKVQFISKHAKDDQYIWESHAASKYSITKDPAGNTLGRGTRIVLHLKDDATKFLEEETLRNLIKRYSEFVQWPIYLKVTKTETVEEPIPEEELAKEQDADAKKKDETEDSETKADDDEMKIEDEDEASSKDTEEKKKTRTVTKTSLDWEQINTQKPIWLRSPKDVTDEEYNDFYKGMFKDYQNPAAKIHFKGEGSTDFKALVFIPPKPAQSVMQMNPEATLRNIKLFVRKVLITDELVEFLPRYLSFLKGLIDSDDFPLNVSRETVQNTPLLKKIKNKVISKALQMFRTLAQNETEYEPVYKAYSGYLKLGIMEDQKNQKRLLKLLRWPSTSTEEGKLTSLDAYVERMRKGQKAIFYLTGSDLDQMRRSPYLEQLAARGYEVLLMDDTLDEYVAERAPKYQDIKLQNIAKGKLEFGDEDENVKKADKELADQFQPLTKWLADHFKDLVEECKVSNRLTTSPCALVAPEFGWSGRMEAIMAQQKDSGNMMYDFFAKKKKIFEINPKHPIMKTLLERVEDDKVDKDTEDLARSLLDMALLKGGFPVKDLDALTRRIENAVRLGLGVDLNAKPDVKVQPAPEVDEEKKRTIAKDKEEEAKEAAKEESDNELPHDEL